MIITSQLGQRPARTPDFAAESRALVTLARTMADSPKSMFQKLADFALELCHAGSAGISVWEPGEANVFRWRATAGAYAPYVGGTLPRDFSPCGEVLDRNACLLMREPVRAYPYIADLCSPVREVLLVPFYQAGVPVGTVWVVAHDDSAHFDAEDERIVTSLTKFAEAAILVLNRIEAAERAEHELREADRKKDDFIATLAHELRNPLAPISTGVSLLSEAEDPQIAHKTLGVMRRQVDHLVRLIDDLLDVSRITQGKLELRREHVPLTIIIEAATEANQLHVERARHTLRKDLCEEELFLDADPTRIAQVIGNLLNNACKYTPDGGQITLSTRREGGRVMISVRDSGLGIPADRLDDVFEMFSQVNRALDRSQGGLGIGLALVRQLVEMHGGEVSVHSAGPGCGSTFSVSLPLAQGAVSLQPSAASVVADLTRGLRVLIVDDNDDAAELLSVALSAAGYRASTAHDAQSAIRATESVVPDLIILDIGLPGTNGYELAQHFRQDPRFAETVFIALTGWGTQADRAKAMAAGFDLHLTKPVSGVDLLRALRQATGAPQGTVEECAG